MTDEIKPLAIVALVIVGGTLIWIGGKTLYEEPDIEHDSALDKWLFSRYTRYFIGRYYAGGQLFMAGVFCIVAAFIVYIAK